MKYHEYTMSDYKAFSANERMRNPWLEQVAALETVEFLTEWYNDQWKGKEYVLVN